MKQYSTEQESIGISDIQVYVPEPKLDVTTLIKERVKEIPKLERHLQRARRVTGQRAIRFPSVWEDTSTMAASSVHKLILKNPELKVDKVRHLAIGTESGVDHSKPVSAYVQGMLRQAGVEFPSGATSFQLQHACAAGTLSMLSVGSMLAAGGREDESGIVACSDIARYKTHSTAEVTQGAGSVSLLVEKNPKLIELDLGSQGYFSSDVDDFFRPLGSKTAQVKGTYSMQCYKEALEKAFLDHCERSERTPEEVLLDTDYFALHTPFRNLPEVGMADLLKRYLGLDESQAAAFLDGKGINDGVEAVAEVGNIYTGAMFLSLASLLQRQYEKLGDKIVGKTVLMASYGSGNIMVVVSGRIAKSAPAVIAGWDLHSALGEARSASFEEYRQWVDGPYVPTGYNHVPQGDNENAPLFTLKTIREDGYREYEFNERRVAIQTEEGEASIHLYESA